ncbi:UDP-glucose/GDP-mannose dehydrogenase family protein [bacterium]|nr:UDP-glucose/GDP-mannose dehydrogenase family protein [bacterium]
MRIHVVGAGWVGLVSAGAFAQYGHEIAVVDSNEERIALLTRGELPFFEAGLADLLGEGKRQGRFTVSSYAQIPFAPEVVFCCVGTPQGALGHADVSAVFSAATWYAEHFPHTLFVVKSTVPPETGKKLSEAFPSLFFATNPEFLAEGTAVRDALFPARIVCGVEDEQAAEMMKRVYAPWVAREVPLLITDRVTAELAKYAANAFLATKISFVNELSEFAELLGANMEMVSKSMGFDPRIGAKFLAHGIGYGGSCFPKDTQALLSVAQERGIDLPLVREAEKRNLRQRDRYVQKILHAYEMQGGRGHVALLGMAYKPGTDDTRSSPAVAIFLRLQQEGVPVKWYDPRVHVYEGSRGEESVDMACKEAAVVFVATDWPEIETFAKTLPVDRVLWGRARGTL